MNIEFGTKPAITILGLGIASTALSGCLQSSPSPYINGYPKWIDGVHKVCTVKLTSNPDSNSLNVINDKLRQLEPNNKRQRALISGQEGHIGQVINLSVANPTTDQHAGDAAVFSDTTGPTCIKLPGNYDYFPHFPPINS